MYPGCRLTVFTLLGLYPGCCWTLSRLKLLNCIQAAGGLYPGCCLTDPCGSQIPSYLRIRWLYIYICKSIHSRTPACLPGTRRPAARQGGFLADFGGIVWRHYRGITRGSPPPSLAQHKPDAKYVGRRIKNLYLSCTCYNIRLDLIIVSVIFASKNLLWN